MIISIRPYTKIAITIVVILIILICGLIVYNYGFGLNDFDGNKNNIGQPHGTKNLAGCDVTQCPYDRPKCCEVYDKPGINETNSLDLLEPMTDANSLPGSPPTDRMLTTKARWTDPTVARTTGIIHSMKAMETSLGGKQRELSMDQVIDVNSRVSPFNSGGIRGDKYNLNNGGDKYNLNNGGDKYNPETIQERHTAVVRRPYDWTARTDAEDLPETVMAGLNSIQMPSTATVREMSRLDSGPDEFAGQVLSAPGSFDAVHAGALKKKQKYSRNSAYPFEHQMNFNTEDPNLTSVSYGRIEHPYGDENYSPGVAINRNAPLMHQPDVNNTPVAGPGVTSYGVDRYRAGAADGPLRPRTKVDNYSNALVDPTDGRNFSQRLYNAI